MLQSVEATILRASSATFPASWISYRHDDAPTLSLWNTIPSTGTMDQHPLHTPSTRASENVASSSQSPSDRTSSSRQAHHGSIQVIPSQRDEQFRASSRGHVYSEAPNTSSNAIHPGERGGEELLFPLDWHLAYTNNHTSSSESPSGNTETASVVNIPEQSGESPPALPRRTNIPLPPLADTSVVLNPHLSPGMIHYDVTKSPMTAICWNIAPAFGPWWLQPATFPITQSMVIRTSIIERPIVVHPSDERHAVVMVWDVLNAVHDAIVTEAGERYRTSQCRGWHQQNIRFTHFRRQVQQEIALEVVFGYQMWLGLIESTDERDVWTLHLY